VNALAKRQIRAATEATLRRAGVSGIVPTPLDEVTRSAGIVEILDIAKLPDELKVSKPGIFKRILGGLIYPERLVFLDRSQSEPRERFTTGHEILHKILPWHEATFRLDHEGTLFRNTRELLEMEANFGAAELLFQGAVFMRRALDYRLTVDAPMVLSEDFGASREASLRYYAENHPDRVALLVGGRFATAAGDVPIFATAESPSFRARYGRVGDLFGRRLPARAGSEIGELVSEAMRSVDVVRGRLVVSDLADQRRGLTAEAFFNQYKILVMVAETPLIPLGKKLVVTSEPQIQLGRTAAP
jgi:hypothetical protein